MARGKWSRWGRGSCEGYSLDLGSLINFSVIRKSSGGPVPDHFEATSHSCRIDSFPTASEAKAYIEAELEAGMITVLEDWTLYQAEKAKRRKP